MYSVRTYICHFATAVYCVFTVNRYIRIFFQCFDTTVIVKVIVLVELFI